MAVVTLYKDATSLESKEISTKKLSSNPEFEEQLSWYVHPTTSHTLQQYSLHVTLRHKRYLGYGDVIGHVMLGSMTSQKSAREQWEKVVGVPHTYHRAEHVLLLPGEES